MQIFKSLAKETLFYGLSYSLGRLLNFLLVTTYLTHKVFEAKDGTLSMYQDIYFYIALLLGLLTLRMETGLFRFTGKDDNDSQKVYSLLSQIVWLGCLIFLLLILVFKKSVLNFLAYPESYERVILLGVGIIIIDVLCSLPFAKLRYDKRSFQFAWIKLLGILINIGLVIFFFEYYFQPSQVQQLTGESKLFYLILANLISSIIVLLLLSGEFIKGFHSPDWSQWKKVYQYIWPLIATTFLWTIIQNGYTSFLKYLLPGSALQNLQASDNLNATFRLAVIMNVFITAFHYAAEPFFFRHAQDKDARNNYARLNLFFVISCCIIYILICTNLVFVSAFIGPGYRDSLYLLPILLLANIFSGIYTNFSSWYKLTDKTFMGAGISLVGVVIYLILFVVLVPILGADSAAWVFLIVNLLMCLISYLQGLKYYPIPYKLMKTILYLILAIAISYLHNKYISVHPLINLFLSLIYAGGILFYVYVKEWKLKNE